MPVSPFYADRVAFEYRIHQLWWALLDAQTAYPFIEGLAPALCSDWETERRKHEIVKYIVVADAQGVAVAALPDYTLCDTFFPDTDGPIIVDP